MPRKRFVKDYLTFSKKDRIGLISLIFLIAIIYLLPRLFTKETDTAFIKSDTTFRQAVDTLQSRKMNADNKEEGYAANLNHYAYEPSVTNSFSTAAEVFTFDPNTLSPEGWERLGLPNKTIRTIDNYRNKGGHFYKPDDVQKIWGLPSGFYNRVKNYITITTTNKYNNINSSTVYAKEKSEKPKVIDINKADTTTFIALPGIGSKLSSRIVAFRDKLGGFYSTAQIGETYGLLDSTFQKIKPFLMADMKDIRKLNINTATKEDLKTHPHIRWNLANAIAEYRNQHGAFKTLEELKNIVLINEETFSKIAPYLAL